MNERQYRLISAAQAAIAFVLGLKDLPLRLAEAAKRLEAALREVEEAQLQQSTAKNLRRAPHMSLNRAKQVLLRKHLGPVAADGLEIFAGLPGIKESLRLPRIKDGPAKHLEAAERVRRVAAGHEQEFITERSYSADFLEQFDSAVRNLEAASRVERGAARVTYTQATENVKEAIARMRRAFDVLDTRVREAYLDDRSKLERWRRQSRIPATLGRPNKRKSSAREDRLSVAAREPGC